MDVCRRLTTGVYVITARHGGLADGFTAAWVMQVSFDPLLVALSVHPDHATWPLMRDSRHFVISVLTAEQQALARDFGTTSGRDRDKLAMVATVPAGRGLAIAAAAAWLECTVHDLADAGDHTLVIGRVVDGAVLHPAAVPLRYAETGNMDGSAALYPVSF
jgi:flavin reductase (DIM6/NTAB) family NADH-FMN oxidoreductase RutF